VQALPGFVPGLPESIELGDPGVCVPVFELELHAAANRAKQKAAFEIPALLAM
jgi:hypothetical protein